MNKSDVLGHTVFGKIAAKLITCFSAAFLFNQNIKKKHSFLLFYKVLDSTNSVGSFPSAGMPTIRIFFSLGQFSRSALMVVVWLAKRWLTDKRQ